MRTKRMIGVSGALFTAALLVSAAAAWACTSLATLDVDPGSGVTGDTVTGEGYGFSGGKASTRGSVTPVQIRWNATDGPLLASVEPDVSGNIRFTFKAPEGAPGYYTVIAIQNNAQGKPVQGTPARATFALNNPAPVTVNGADAAATVTQQTPGGQAPSAVVYHQAPSPAAPAAHGAPRPQQQVQVVKPSGARATDILGPASRSRSGAGTQVGLMLAALGFGALVAAGIGVAAFRSPRRMRA